MLLLTNTNNSLELQTSVAGNVDYHASYADHTSSTFSPLSSEGNIAAATTTTIVAAPAASTQRQIKFLLIRNKATTNQTITVKKDVGGTEYVLYATTLLSNESLQYIDGHGFSVLDNIGRAKIYNPYTKGGPDGFSEGFLKVGSALEASGQWYSFGKDSGNPGAWSPGTPGLTGRATDGTTPADTGCLRIKNPSVGANYLTGFNIAASATGSFWLMDILWVNSGIVVTTTTAQAINSVAFPARDVLGAANGESCWVGILVTAATTNASAITNTTLSYTNSDGVTGKTATMASFPATAVVGTVVWFQLAAGDRGVQSIQSVTLGTSYAGGSISLIVARPVINLPIVLANVGSNPAIDPNTGLRLYNGTCLIPLVLGTGTGALTISGSFTVAEK
jgi:hypothetical protein